MLINISNYNYSKKLHNLYVATYAVHTDSNFFLRNSLYKNIQNVLRNIVKKVLEDNGYYYFGTTSYIKYDFKSYNIDYRILSHLEEEFLLESIKRELLSRRLPLYYMNNIELRVAV